MRPEKISSTLSQSLRGGGNQSQGPEVEDEAGEDSEDPLPVGDRTESDVMTGSETGGDEDAVTRGPLQASPSQLQQWQQEDPSLGKAREAAWDSQPEGASSRVYFFYRDGLLHRHWQPEGSQPGDVRSVEQLVLPRPCRGVVLRLGHDVPMAGHLGIRKTRSRIMHRYYWPGIFKDVAAYCRTCEVCQRTQTRRPPKAGMVPMPLVAKPFQPIAMDFVGPLPRTQRGIVLF